MIVVRAWIEVNLYRNALHHFDVISCGILRRQQAEARAAGAGNAVHFAAVFAPVSVNFDGDGLSWSHIPQLSYFEVRGDPDVVEVNDFHQLLSGSHILAYLDGAVADDSIHGSDNLGVLQVECCLI